jgi:hypothetical protein
MAHESRLGCEMRCEAHFRIWNIESIKISEKRTRNHEVDILIFITKRPLLLYINYLLVSAID